MEGLRFRIHKISPRISAKQRVNRSGLKLKRICILFCKLHFIPPTICKLRVPVCKMGFILQTEKGPRAFCKLSPQFANGSNPVCKRDALPSLSFSLQMGTDTNCICIGSMTDVTLAKQKRRFTVIHALKYYILNMS